MENDQKENEVIQRLAVTSWNTVNTDRFNIYLLANMNANILFCRIRAKNGGIEKFFDFSYEFLAVADL